MGGALKRVKRQSQNPSAAPELAVLNGEAQQHERRWHVPSTRHPEDHRWLFFFVSVAEVNEGETALTTCLPVEGHRTLADFSVLAEQVDEVFSLCVPGEITNENRQKINPKGIAPFSHIATSIGEMHLSS